jgi:uncharacterized protein YfaS (alpha-2-macroglobulin family)
MFSPYQRRQELLSLFIPTVWVGPTGEAEIEIKVPEYSGKARLTAVAGSLERFGVTSASVDISRDYTVETTIPLAVAPGDEFIATSRIFKDAKASESESASESDDGIEVNFSTTGPLTIVEAQDDDGPFDFASYKPEIGPGQGRTVRLTIKAVSEKKASAEKSDDGAEQTGNASVGATVNFGKESFVQEATTIVRPPFPRVFVSSGAQLKEGDNILELNAQDFLTGTVSPSLMVAPGATAEVARAVEFLRHYPYGCLEQTVSAAWVHLIARDLGSYMSDEGDTSSELALDGAVKRLATMQTFSGGFATWPGGSSVYSWGSVYATHFLTEAKKRTELPNGLLEDAIAYLKGELSQALGSPRLTRHELAVKAYALYVLALNGEYNYGWINTIKDREAGLNESAKIFLAAAIAVKAGRPDALIELGQLGAGETDENSYSYSLESPSRNRALRLLAFSQVDPLNPMTDKLAEQVASDGRNGYWSQTQENGMAVLSLGTYIKETGVSEPFEALLKASDGTILAKGDNLDPLNSGPKILEGYADKPITVSVSGQGKPWYSLTVSGVPMQPPAVENNGLILTKKWLVLAGDKTEEAHFSSFGTTPDELIYKKGQKVVVELTVLPAQHTQNVVIADLVPGGFEIAGMEEGDFADRVELREDRMIAVIDDLIGIQTIRYSLRAVTEGTFVLPPTTAEGMYNPDRKAVLPTAKVKVVR